MHGAFSWPLLAAAIALAAVGGAVVAWWLLPRTANESAVTQTAALAISPEQYNLFAGYEELALVKRIDDPKASIDAINAALFQMRSMRSAFPGSHPVFAPLFARLSELSRRAGDVRQADTYILEAGADIVETVGEYHPFAAMVALELARNAHAVGDHPKVATQLLRALGIRWRVLGLAELGQRQSPLVDRAVLEQCSQQASSLDDTDDDGLLDVIELAVGLDPRTEDSDADGVPDDDEDHDADGVRNRLALALSASPFLTWAHYGAYEPRPLMWQAPSRYPLLEEPHRGSSLAAWSVTAPQAMGYFEQRLSPAHSTRAIDHGFSLLARVSPVAGWTALAVDPATSGPRFDIAIRRVDDGSVEVRLLSSVVPREGPVVIVDSLRHGRWSLLELQYRARSKTATLYIDGRPSLTGYVGHYQYQESRVVWGVSATGDGDRRASAVFNLVWLEIF